MGLSSIKKLSSIFYSAAQDYSYREDAVNRVVRAAVDALVGPEQNLVYMIELVVPQGVRLTIADLPANLTTQHILNAAQTALNEEWPGAFNVEVIGPR